MASQLIKEIQDLEKKMIMPKEVNEEEIISTPIPMPYSLPNPRSWERNVWKNAENMPTLVMQKGLLSRATFNRWLWNGNFEDAKQKEGIYYHLKILNAKYPKEMDGNTMFEKAIKEKKALLESLMVKVTPVDVSKMKIDNEMQTEPVSFRNDLVKMYDQAIQCEPVTDPVPDRERLREFATVNKWLNQARIERDKFRAGEKIWKEMNEHIKQKVEDSQRFLLNIENEIFQQLEIPNQIFVTKEKEVEVIKEVIREKQIVKEVIKEKFVDKFVEKLVFKKVVKPKKNYFPARFATKILVQLWRKSKEEVKHLKEKLEARAKPKDDEHHEDQETIKELIERVMSLELDLKQRESKENPELNVLKDQVEQVKKMLEKVKDESKKELSTFDKRITEKINDTTHKMLLKQAESERQQQKEREVRLMAAKQMEETVDNKIASMKKEMEELNNLMSLKKKDFDYLKTTTLALYEKTVRKDHSGVITTLEEELSAKYQKARSEATTKLDDFVKKLEVQYKEDIDRKLKYLSENLINRKTFEKSAVRQQMKYSNSLREEEWKSLDRGDDSRTRIEVQHDRQKANSNKSRVANLDGSKGFEYLDGRTGTKKNGSPIYNLRVVRLSKGLVSIPDNNEETLWVNYEEGELSDEEWLKRCEIKKFISNNEPKEFDERMCWGEWNKQKNINTSLYQKTLIVRQ